MRTGSVRWGEISKTTNSLQVPTEFRKAVESLSARCKDGMSEMGGESPLIQQEDELLLMLVRMQYESYEAANSPLLSNRYFRLSGRDKRSQHA